MIKKSNESFGKGKQNESNIRKRFEQNKKVNIGSRSRSSKPNMAISPYPKCNKGHMGECCFGKNLCYQCDQEGHFALNGKAYLPMMDYEQNKKEKAKV